MADQRLEVIMKKTEPQYASGSPLLLEASALYLDKGTNNCIAQLKWRSIDPRPIKAVMIELAGFDAFDQALEVLSYQYDRLQVSQGDVFGDKSPVTIPSNNVVRFEVTLKAVSFVEGKIWEGTALFSVLPSAKKLGLEPDLYNQYKRDLQKKGYEPASQYAPQQANGLWQCGCGSWQQVGSVCLKCGASWELLQDTAEEKALLEHLDEYKEEQLRLKKLAEEERIAREAEEAEKQKALMKQRAAEEAAAKIAAQKRKKTTIIISIAGTLLVALIACYMLIIKPMNEYNSAMDLMKAGKYDEATAAFELMGDYSDASTQAKESQYQKGKSQMAAGDYVSAYFTLLAIQDYSDVNTQLNSDQIFIQIQANCSQYQNKGNIIKLGYGTYQTVPRGWSDTPAYVPPVLDLPSATNVVDTSTESYPLEWIVLSYDEENKRALLLSRYVFGDRMPFDSNDGYSWSSSSLRTWLNSDFYNNAFFEDEKATILPTRLDNSYGANDFVFLLSKDEADQYLPDSNERRGLVRSAESDNYTDWWLRSSGYRTVDQVMSYGGYYSSKYPDLSEGVRPALWVDVQSIVKAQYACFTNGASLLSAKQYDEAISSFMNARQFANSENMVIESQYQKAESLFTAREYDEAARTFIGIIEYKDSLNRAKECIYQKAISLINDNNFEAAYEALVLIPGYSDVDQMLKTNQNLITARKSCFSKVGNTVRFGKFEQDGIETNGKEDIKWIVVAYNANNKTALLVSKYALDERQFGDKKTSKALGNYGKRMDPDYPGWADSRIHKWLSSDFISAAFTKEEQDQIATTSVSTSSYKGWSRTTSGGPVTQDKVFLLSKEEVTTYFKNSKDRMCAPTQYAVQQGSSTNHDTTEEGLGATSWWLRDPYTSSDAVYVSYSGSTNGMPVDYKMAIRPALWIKLE